MGKFERWYRSLRLRAKWRRSYNRSLRAIVGPGGTKRGRERFWNSLGIDNTRVNWTGFIRDWDEAFSKER